MKFSIKNNLKKYCIGLLSLICVVTISCDKFLDVRPEGEIPNDQLFDDAAGFEAALYGVYSSMNNTSLYGRTLSHETIELLAQYFNLVGGANDYVENVKKYNYLHSDIQSRIGSVWSNMYKNIANVNNVLINLDKKSASSMRFYNIYKGEALGLRAFMHFDLLRLFTADVKGNQSAEGIPYSIKYDMNPSAFSAVAKVYDFIIADLLAAEELLANDAEYFTYPKVNPTEEFLRDREIHFNLFAVKATLARVYLTKGDKVNAAKYAKQVVESHKFELMDKGEVGNSLPKGTLYPKEIIFGLYNTAYFSTVNSRFQQQTTNSSYILRPDILNVYQLEQVGIDYRYGSYVETKTLGTVTSRLFVKLVDPYQVREQVYLRPKGLLDGINLIRIPEMYYILAESLLESDPAEAMNYFNAVLESRGLMSLDERPQPLPLTLERINNERYKELIGEGQTFFNMKRLNLNIKNTADVIVPASNQIYVWPIPNDEKEHNN